MRIKKKITMALAVCSLFMTGCSSVMSLGVDGLVAAPKLSDEQSVIHETLIKSVGDNISLKYPKNGDNRSAFLVANIDDEPTDEALVFYQLNNASSGDAGVRINVMDQTDGGQWKSVFDLAGKGTDIDRVSIMSSGNKSVYNVVIGYSAMTMEGKTLQICRYDGKTFTPSVYDDTYSVMEIFDIDKDGRDEIVTVLNSPATATATAAVIESTSSSIEKTQTIPMSSDTVSFVSTTIGLADNEKPAMFVDCLKSSGEIQTEIIYFKYNKLQNPVLQLPDKLLVQTTRPAGYYSKDIDGDGIVEIPVTELMPGHENLPDEEKVLMTSWLNFKDFYELESKYSGYYSISNGYQMIFPKRWQGVVTTKIDAATKEAVFYSYSGDVSAFMVELMRITVCPKNETEDYEYQGYEIIGSSGQLDYLVKLPTYKREPLILTMDEVKNSFYIVQ